MTGSKWKHPLLNIIYVITLLFLSILARLVPFAVVIVALFVFFIGIWTLSPALTVVGFSEQEVAATMGITVIVGVWAIAVALYFRYREPDATQ
ncbi:hypothetical protein [Natronorubrum sp. A-ect3]|uniref:hypothetical protein n=1 Tax=Natronorubrum sp. A-ect3 TaxID=3242698 RepID=UPI00359EF592